MKYVLFAILLYVLYRFIFHFLLPVYLATKKIKKGFREMSARMNQSDGQSRFDQTGQHSQKGFRAQPSASSPPPKTKAGDYIDFEEVK